MRLPQQFTSTLVTYVAWLVASVHFPIGKFRRILQLRPRHLHGSGLHSAATYAGDFLFEGRELSCAFFTCFLQNVINARAGQRISLPVAEQWGGRTAESNAKPFSSIYCRNEQTVFSM